MNQTAWIIGGGVLILVIAGFFFVASGDGASKKELTVKVPDAIPPTSETAAVADAFRTQAPVTTVPLAPTTPAPVEEPAKEPAAPRAATVGVFHTSMGDITVKLYTGDAPKTVENFAKLAASGFYDGVKFHRVIKGFMIQSGDPKSKDDSLVGEWGTGGPGYQFADEINAGSDLYQRGYTHGVLAMANSGANTNGSQFFIMASNYRLPPQYTIFGEVTSGLDVVDAIDHVATNGSDRPLQPVVVKSVEVK